jgi:hypothetical protein
VADVPWWPLLVGALAVPAAQTPPPPSWHLSVDVYTYFVPDESNYAQPTVTADRGRLRLEGRFNYEARNTGSLWLGCNFGGGDESWWAITPMVGAVFGDTKGVAPGYQGWISGRRLEFYSEGEFVVDTSSSSDSFFYNWSELTVAPVDWLRVGFVTQRTRAYQTDREIQRGLLVGVSRGKLDLSAIVFNPDESKPVVVVMVAVHF